ncbi:ATP-dependent DNA helicase [Caerostris darwini]|uniref:ATP-dependent DNA helicase n=1 Tax=Caerostris darwini TaxID=1538125 RepID=A0AAV4S231_9ARAC|nr:ATP-dependent DNA helicase [Caerostris darwini]
MQDDWYTNGLSPRFNSIQLSDHFRTLTLFVHLDIQKYVIKRIFQNSYQKAIEDGTIDEFDHKNPPLNDKVLEVIKPIYESLSADSLLERCLGSETQNNNESLNYVMGITIGPEANAFAARRDEARIERSELRTSEASKEGRTARLHQRTSENEHFEVEEGFLYEAGIAD